MANLGGANPFGSAHADVLNAKPSDAESKIKLVEEIRNRAKRVMADKNYPVAETLYSKAIKVLPDAPLYGNRAAARFGLGKFQEAVEDAEESIKIDANYSKAYYRKGQACSKLKRFDEAIAAFERGVELEPENKLFKSLVTKTKDEQAKAAENPQEEKDEPPPLREPAPPRTQPRAAVAKSKKAEKAEEDDDEDAKAGTSEFRGYKKTADGRTTTFFNREIDDQAKALIGDIRPQKITDEAAVPAPVPVPAGGSAWNTAGTWEEKSMTEWAKEKITEVLVGVEADLPNDMGTVETTDIKSLDGDAMITRIRGKKKYLFDFSFKLHWEVTMRDVGKCKGTLTYLDVTPDCDGDYDVQFEVKRETPPAARDVLNAFVRNSSQGLQPAVAAKIKEFMQEFQAVQ